MRDRDLCKCNGDRDAAGRGKRNGMEWKKKAYNLFREFLYAMLMSSPLIFRKVFGVTCCCRGGGVLCWLDTKAVTRSVRILLLPNHWNLCYRKRIKKVENRFCRIKQISTSICCDVCVVFRLMCESLSLLGVVLKDTPPFCSKRRRHFERIAATKNMRLKTNFVQQITRINRTRPDHPRQHVDNSVTKA